LSGKAGWLVEPIYQLSVQKAGLDMLTPVLGLLPDFILVLFLKCVQQAQCRRER
jgi:hypothetical protein